MPYTTTTLKANAEALINALPTTPTVKQLLKAFNSAQGLNCSNYSIVKTKLQALIDNQTPSTPDGEIMLAAMMVGSVQAQTNTTEVTQTTATSLATYPVPTGAIKCLVSAGTKGGDGETDSQAAGGGGGAWVGEFEIGVDGSGSGVLEIVYGNTIQVGDLILTGGGDGASNDGGLGGTVTYQGQLQPNSSKVLNGADGGDYGQVGGSLDIYDDQGSVIATYAGGTASNSYGGGGASYGGNGGGGVQYNTPQYGSGGGAYDTGGVAFPEITLKFIIETVV